FWHSGIEYHWWHGPADCTGALPSTDPEALLNALAATPTIRCDQAAWTFYGLSLAGFNAIISWGLAVFLLFWRSESVSKSRSASK
ncbi:MAG: disulfide bond formation protein B, partial [Alphaproteobacteria bacterium]|nr:disulfide bond formation protein B [Alphaproteobacteria bacterium]